MNKNKIITLRLRESERDIICWIKSLPNYTINKYINAIIIAESRKRIESIPCKCSYMDDNIKNCTCAIQVKDKRAINFIERIPKGKINATLIKIIRKHLQKNRKTADESFEMDYDILAGVLNEFQQEMTLKEKEYRFSRKKYEKYCEAYVIAKREIRDAVFRCYKSVDEKTGDDNLKHLDYRSIAAEAFEMSFGYVPPKWMRVVLRKI